MDSWGWASVHTSCAQICASWGAASVARPRQVHGGLLPPDRDRRPQLEPGQGVVDAGRERRRRALEQALHQRGRLRLPTDQVAGIGDDALPGLVEEVRGPLVVEPLEVLLGDDQAVPGVGDPPLALDLLEGELPAERLRRRRR